MATCICATDLNAQSAGQNGIWNVNANGSWSTNSNWTSLSPGSDYPSGVGATAQIIRNITGTRTITLDVPVTLGTLFLGDTNNTNAFVIGSAPGDGMIIFDNGGLGNLNNGAVAGAYFNHNSGTTGLSPSSSDRIDAAVSLNDALTIDSDRNIEFRGAWTGNNFDLTLINSNTSGLLNNERYYWNASGTNLGVLSGVNTFNIINGEARFDGIAGTADSQLIGAATINLGNGTLQTDGKVFPRLFLVNTETAQTANLNMNGGWLVSDLGSIDDMIIWSGNINITGAATTNIIDVNDAGTADTHIITGVISGTGGFSKVNTGTLQLTADNTIEGEIYIQRGGVGGANLASEGSVRLTSATGAFSAVSSIVISRDGSLYLDNATDIKNDRFNDTAGLVLRGQGRLRLVSNSGAATTETLGVLLQDTGSGKINFDLDDTTPQDMALTFASYTRNAGSITQFQVLDNVAGAFGSYTAGNALLIIADGGATALIKGGGGGNGSTNKSIVIGAFAGVNNVSNHFMTFDELSPTELRPLKWDGTQAGSEYFLTRDSLTVAHSITAADLGTLDQNVLINYNVNTSDGDVDWYGIRPVNIQENVAMNSLRFGTETSTSTTNAFNTNEIGSALVLAPGVHVYLGDSLAVNTGLSGDTDGSGMILFGRAVDGSTPGSNQYIAGGVLDFGSREAIIVNESGNSALIRSNIVGSGGLTKAGSTAVYLDNSNSYTGDTHIAEGVLDVRDQNALGDSTLVKIEGSGQLYLELGTNVINSATTSTPPDLFIGSQDASRVVLYSNNSNNTWGGNIIIDDVDNLGNWVFKAEITVNALATLNLNGNIYGNELANPISTDISLNDARLVSTAGGSSSGGVININGQFRDNASGAVSSVVTSDNENQLLRFQIAGSNELVVNVRQAWNAAGIILLEQGILRYEGDGNFWTTTAASVITASNSQSGLRMSGTAGGTNNGTANNAIILTKAGQALNISRIDIGGDGTNNFNAKGNVMLAGTNTSGTVTFGDGTGTVNYTGSSAANAFVRDLTLYASGGGTVNLDFRLDDTDGDSHTSFTKIGRGVVNYNSAGTTNGDVEQLNMSGGLLRLTNYGTATGTRFDTGAMIILAGGGIEMDGVGSIANETANYTGLAVAVNAAFPTAETIIAPGGTDVIVTSDAGRTTTMNIGSGTIPLTRYSGGTVNFVENSNGGTSVITLQGTGAPADGTAISWATYGDTYSYNAAAATYTLNALDFAMITSGDIEAFAGATRENTDDVSLWTIGNDVSESAGFTGTTAVGASINTLRFSADALGTITVDGGGLEITSGGIMVSSLVATDTSAKTISGGPITAGADADLIIHQYGAAALTIGSEIADNAGSAAGNALVKTGAGTLILTGSNTYTGKTFLNGGVLSISSDDNLGTAPGATVTDGIYINGGILNTTADMTLDANRGITLGGNGGEVNVAGSTTLTYGGVIASEPNLTAGYRANPAVGRIDKTGAGTLIITGFDNTYSGLTDIKEGTLVWAPATIATSTRTPFGSNSAFLDGTIVRSGATLALYPSSLTNTGSSQTQILQEWFTFEGGSTLDMASTNSAADPHNVGIAFRGVLQFDSLGHAGTPDGFQTADTLAGAAVVNVSHGTNYFNDAGGYITGDGGITKVGSGYLGFRENNPEWTGQLIVSEGQVELFSAGDVAGVGTLPIILGHNLYAEQAGEFVTGNGTVTLTYRDEGGYRDVGNINQDIIVRADDGAGAQTKRIGARYMAEADVVNYNGSLTLRDDVQFFYQDDARDSTNQTSTSNTRNDTRATGALTNSETVYINFNGNIIGAAGNNITLSIVEGGNGNVLNGSITGAGDDLVLRPIFGLNGDNSGWAGNLILGNTTSDVDTQNIVSIGSDLGIGAQNNVTMKNNATLQTSGHNVIIGSLTDTGVTLDNYIENASTTSGSITLTQSVDATVDLVIRDGVNFFELQPGEVDAALSFVKAGTARLTLTQGNTFTGTTTLAGGTLQLAYDADNSMLSDTAALIMNNGILDLSGTVAHSEVVLSTTINGIVAIERSSGSSIINLNTITRNAGSLRIAADNIATTDNTNVNGILGGWATAGGSWATNSTNGADGLIVGLTTFEQNIDRLGGGAGVQTISDGSNDNVRIIEDGSTVSPITLAASGTTTIYTLLQGASGGEAVVDIGAGNTLRIATGGVLLSDGSTSLTFAATGTLTGGSADNTAATMFLQNQDSTGAQYLTVGAVLADNGSGVVDVRTTGPGTTVFTAANTYTGNTLVGSGVLAIGDGGTTGTLGSGDVTVEASGVLAFNRSDTGLVVSSEISGEGTVAQNGSGMTTLDATATANKLNFVAVSGTLATGIDNAINTTGSLIFGDTNGAVNTAAVTLGGDASVGSLLVQTNSSVANQLVIATGKTLTINGGVTIGDNSAAGTATKLSASGGGNLMVNSSGADFQVGGATGSTNRNSATVDFSGLTNFTADLGAGIFRVGDNATTSSGANASSLTLAVNNTITAGSILVGDGSGPASVHTLTLGSGTNTLNADILNIGSAVSRVRSSGVIKFDAADTTGSVTIRGADGTSRALINMINTTGSTGSHMTANMDLSGHTADILASAVTMAYRSANTGNATATLTFDQGTLDFLSLTLASRAGSGSGNATATLDLRDSVALGTPTTTIGSIDMGVNTSTNAGSLVTADINVTGGNVNIGTGSGTAINMAFADTGRTVNSTIDLTGGTTTVTGGIIRTGGPGSENATLTLDGGTLDMSGNSIGSAAAEITFIAASGTLKNIAGLNEGGGLTKTTNGLLIMDGVNSYTGVTTVAAGTLQFAKETAFYNNTQASWTDTNLVVQSGATAAFNVGGAGEFTTADIDVIKDLGSASGGFLGGSTLGIDTTNAPGTVTYGTAIADTNSGGNSIGLDKLGTGTLELTAVSTYTGATTVSGGTLLVNNNNGSGTGIVSGDLNVESGTVALGASTGGMLTVAGNLNVGAGGTLQMQLGGATLNDSASISGFESNLSGISPSTISSWENANTQSLHDHILSNDAVSPVIDGVVQINLNGYSAVYGDVFDLLDWTTMANSITGATSFDFSGAALDSGLSFNTQLFASNGIIVVVPEPSRVLLFFLGLFGLLLRRRR
ncbi:MAG: autotransporter-associated beta strand repeat-containing protein [Prosthecobacter sp.]|uniref:beta strand repeat-containing protein n=1 Tax=Prosthecobacter sp. TaxID=1965333 RepID=UPI0025F1EE8B|nr:autotransporter-associated beta strand repeat-containing protein [Prosthecobacter sp.]MCF7784977.1 autotransporter-associated beta strand repeat-containing protein [Prosthecobacter sp.]